MVNSLLGPDYCAVPLQAGRSDLIRRDLSSTFTFYWLTRRGWHSTYAATHLPSDLCTVVKMNTSPIGTLRLPSRGDELSQLALLGHTC